MLLIAVHDGAGVIIGAVVDDGELPIPVPLAPEGYVTSSIELTDEQARLPLDVLCTTMRVDARSHGLIPAESASAN
jgi:hypothetical protein